MYVLAPQSLRFRPWKILNSKNFIYYKITSLIVAHPVLEWLYLKKLTKICLYYVLNCCYIKCKYS